jgi:hypothetical protein
MRLKVNWTKEAEKILEQYQIENGYEKLVSSIANKLAAEYPMYFHPEKKKEPDFEFE